ncbi:disease resistance protein At4g27190-like [Trifolium pratense]|uniref:disease resistance protein At4g27190-like n=1 Tax=Trifolium pratense TaxID=57577 RepID=UPI001E691DA6|nr:disease resistance protein At4g27190-like [Trifolium pratense]XP_045821574.1 disease resistance protein At4g27190-like [Trifolium pratense]XP_045821575.1 disease resistance protein At4g27190-like [Trifolium pratense]
MPNLRDSLEREKRIAKEFVRERIRLHARWIRFMYRTNAELGKEVERDDLFWKEKVEEFIQEDTKTKQTYFFGVFPNSIWPYKRGKKLENNTEEIQRLKREYIFEIIADLRRRADDVRYSSQYYISFKSRESEYKELLDALKDDNNYITGLQGMGGTGKTTLAKEVGKELKQSEQFSHVIDTTVSFTPDIKKIQDDIAGSLGMKWENCSESERAIKLWRRLTNGEKILLIVDDVWDQNPPLDFEAIGIPNRDDHKGCRVLVTTRCRRMLYKMNCDKRIELDLLTEEDAWIMFERYAGISNSSSNSVIRKGHEIAKECKQLPIAIAVMVRSCKGHGDRIVAWDMTLKSLKNRASIHYVDEDMAEIYKALKFSYDYITDEKAKGLFLLCSLFRENEEISIEVLTRFIIGVGLFEDNYDNYNDARNRVIVAKNELLDHYLLLEVGEKHVKMHDLVRAMAQWIANKEIQGVNLSKTNQKLFVERETNIKYLSCEGKDMDLFSCKFKGSNLETLIVKVDRDEDRKCIEVPNSFFENLVKIRVLYFLGNDERPLSLPHSICLLKNIRSMLVDSVDLGDISILGNLQSLETLDLVQCTITEFPREITKLEKLTLLKLEYCEIKRNNPFEVIERCSSLEELYFIDSFNGFCQEINFPELQIYHIRKGRAVMDDSLSKYVVFPSNDDACCFSNAKLLKYCMQTAEVLQLNGIKGEWRNLMPEIVPIHLGMDDLLELRLSCISQLQCLVDTIGSQVPTVLSKMVVLELNRMENLKELFKGTLSLDSMKNLEELSINDCKHLQSLFKCKLNLCNLKTIKLQRCPMLVSLYQLLTSRNLVLLETLKIGDCENLKNIIADERREEESIEEIHDDGSILGSLMFPKLKVVDIEGCPLLESIFPFLFVHDLPVLETIKIRRCDGLQYIFGQFQDAEFGSLRELELFQLPNFIDMFCKSNHPSSLSEKGSSFTSNNGSKAPLQLDLDPAKCKDTATTTIPLVDGDNSGKEASNPEFDHKESNSHCLNNKCVGTMFPKLEVLDIEGCPLLESIFLFLFVQDFPVLETIKIRRCHRLKFMFGQYQHVEFSSLRQLELCQLPNFIDMFRKSNHPISLYEKGSSSTFNSDSKAQLQLDLDPMKCNIFSEDITTTTIPLVDGVDYSESNSYYLTIWNQAQCLQIPSKILYNIKKIELSQFSKIKSVFIPSIAPRMLVETLTIRNCDELKNIIDFGDYDSGSNTWCNVFPKLKELYIEGCPKMEYIFGQYTDDHQNQVDIRLHLLELNCLNLCNLPSLVAMCPKHYKIIFPILEKFKLSKCSQAAIKSLSHVRIHPVSESLDSTFIKEDGAGEIVITKSSTQHINGETWQEPKKTNDVQVSRNNDAFKKEGSNIVEQFPKDHYTIVSKSLVASQFPLVPSKGDPSQNVEYLTSSSLCTRELEQLVSKKHLDYENLSLLTDFLVKNPSLRLKDTSVSNRYKGCAYNLLAELLKFLQTHSVLDVLGSCRTEFVELLQDARSFGFDKDWLDDVERRALFPDIQVYQDTLQKVLDSRQQVTKDVEVLCSKTDGLTNQLTSSEAILKNISQQNATISASIGY